MLRQWVLESPSSWSGSNWLYEVRGSYQTQSARYHWFHVDADDYVSRNNALPVRFIKEQRRAECLKCVIPPDLPLSENLHLHHQSPHFPRTSLTNPKVICAVELSHIFETNVDWIVRGGASPKHNWHCELLKSDIFKSGNHFTPTFCLLCAMTFSRLCVFLLLSDCFQYLQVYMLNNNALKEGKSYAVAIVNIFGLLFWAEWFKEV